MPASPRRSRAQRDIPRQRSGTRRGVQGRGKTPIARNVGPSQNRAQTGPLLATRNPNRPMARESAVDARRPRRTTGSAPPQDRGGSAPDHESLAAQTAATGPRPPTDGAMALSRRGRVGFRARHHRVSRQGRYARGRRCARSETSRETGNPATSDKGAHAASLCPPPPRWIPTARMPYQPICRTKATKSKRLYAMSSWSTSAPHTPWQPSTAVPSTSVQAIKSSSRATVV